MKIVSKNILNPYISKQNFAKQSLVPKNATPVVSNETSFASVSLEHLNSLYNINFCSSKIFEDLQFEPVSKTRPIYTPSLEYDDIDRFCEEYEKKIHTQLMNPDIDDINVLINEISAKTNAPLDLVLEVLWRLTQFSSYDSLAEIEKTMQKEKNGFLFGLFGISEHQALDYLASCKFDFNIPKGYNSGLFIDDALLSGFEDANKRYASSEQKHDYKTVQAYADSSPHFKVYILDGANVKASNGKYYGADFLTGSGYLKSLAIDVIKKVQAKKDLDEVLNGDLIDRYNKLFPLADNKFVIVKKPVPDKITPDMILENLKAKAPNKEQIKRCITTPPRRRAANKDKFDAKSYQKTIMKYLDNFTFVFSPASIEFAIKNGEDKVKRIVNSSGKNDVFYVPYLHKSYALITHMFQKNCQIPNDKIKIDYRDIKKGANVVVFDDMSISGDSILECSSRLFSDLGDDTFDQCKFYFVPIVSSASEDSYFDNTKIKPIIKAPDMDSVFSASSFSLRYEENPSNIFKTFEIDEIMQMCTFFESGYSGGISAIVFPYMIPDNSSDIIGKMFDCTLYRTTNQSNKAKIWQ